jgi:hypothetical protein
MTTETNTPTSTESPNGGMPPAPPQQQHPAENPRTRGHSPARDQREQSAADPERKVSVAGVEYTEQSIADAMAERVERQLARETLPRDPNGYQVKLPEGFKPPEGMQFEFNADDPALKTFREIAHRRGMDQDTFSEALGAFASVKVAELQQVNAARAAQMAKLGATAPQRIDAIEQWFAARVGDKANVLTSTLKLYPVAATVEALEGVIRLFSSQGSGGFTQSHREAEDPRGTIPGYENMTFAQKRAAQMNRQYGGGGNR